MKSYLYTYGMNFSPETEIVKAVVRIVEYSFRDTFACLFRLTFAGYEDGIGCRYYLSNLVFGNWCLWRQVWRLSTTVGIRENRSGSILHLSFEVPDPSHAKLQMHSLQ